MPVTQQALKKLRHDRVQTIRNTGVRVKMRLLIKKMRKSPTKKGLSSVSQVLDKAAKIHIIHKKKASRLKSRLSKLIKSR